ncbi:MAG: hypothetical protein HY002_06880 [Candidatus Rokubacteria bacterium]|nr:hypothetical protein [Candidatus Rokubacteria bacterium]
MAGTALLCLAGVAVADWSSCQDELDRLRRRASDASDAAGQVSDAADRLKRKKRDLEDCRDSRSPSCSSEEWDYDTARRAYESAKSDLDSKISDVDYVYRSANSSCTSSTEGRPLTRTTPPGLGRQHRACPIIRNYKTQFQPPVLLGICQRFMTEEECRECLE